MFEENIERVAVIWLSEKSPEHRAGSECVAMGRPPAGRVARRGRSERGQWGGGRSSSQRPAGRDQAVGAWSEPEAVGGGGGGRRGRVRIQRGVARAGPLEGLGEAEVPVREHLWLRWR